MFKNNFENTHFVLKEDIIKKLIAEIKGTTKNLTIEELLNALKIKNKDIIADIFPIKSICEEREQNAIIISNKSMIKILNEDNATILD